MTLHNRFICALAVTVFAGLSAPVCAEEQPQLMIAPPESATSLQHHQHALAVMYTWVEKKVNDALVNCADDMASQALIEAFYHQFGWALQHVGLTHLEDAVAETEAFHPERLVESFNALRYGTLEKCDGNPLTPGEQARIDLHQTFNKLLLDDPDAEEMFVKSYDTHGVNGEFWADLGQTENKKQLSLYAYMEHDLLPKLEALGKWAPSAQPADEAAEAPAAEEAAAPAAEEAVAE